MRIPSLTIPILACVVSTRLAGGVGGPEAGELAPDFTLATRDRTREVRLSQLRGRPTVLVFGSYT